MRKGLVFAMEQETDQLPVEEVAMVPETQAEVETASAEIAEQVGDVEQLEGSTVEAEGDAETMETMVEVAEDSVEKGEGLDETSAQIAEVAVENICARLGIDNTKGSLPALESFGSKSSRLSATKVAVEDWKDKIVQIWRAIMAAVKSVWEKVKSFIAGLLKSRALLLNHLESLKKRVANLDGGAKPKEATLKSAGLGKAFGIGGKANASTASTVLEDARKLFDVASAAVQQSTSTASAILNFEKDPVAAAKNKHDLVLKIHAEIDKLGKVGSGSGDNTHYGHLVGGKAVSVKAVDSKSEGASLEITIDEVEKNGATEAESLTREQMTKLIDEAIAVVKALKEYDKIEKDLAKLSSECSKVTEAILKGAANREEDKEKADAIRKGASDVRQLNSMIAKFGASVPSAIFGAAKAAGDYVAASLGNHGAEKKTEEKKA